MNKNPKIFVIIVTYKGRQWYDRCFTSLRQSTMPVQTIVVDNSPGEDDVKYIREHFPEVVALKSEQNLGFGKGNNLAMKYAREQNADYVFLLNQDTWLIDKDMFAKLVSISEKYPEYGILSPLHVKADENTLGMMLEYQTNNTSSMMLNDLLKGEIADVYATNFVNAAAWLLPRKTLEVVGGFDPIYQHYEEDDDYLNRVRYHGLKIGVCPSIRLVHDHQDMKNPFDEKKARYRHEQLLLVDMMNINKENSIGLQIRYYFRKLPVLFFFGKWSAMRSMWKDMLYIVGMRKAILHSREQNIQKEASWL